MYTEMELMMKCDMCYDRTSAGMKPMCASVCPSGALAFGRRDEVVERRRERPADVFLFGPQAVRTKVQLMVPAGSPDVEMDVAVFMARGR
jgi:Fe-S-cluster-containing dehydrogenase component